MFKNIFSNIGKNSITQSISGTTISNSSIIQSSGDNKVMVNGKTINVPSGNISIINGKIFVDGKEFNENDNDLNKDCKIINITIEGNVDSIKCSGSVNVKGNVFNGIDCGGSVDIEGNVEGTIDCGGSVNIK